MFGNCFDRYIAHSFVSCVSPFSFRFFCGQVPAYVSWVGGGARAHDYRYFDVYWECGFIVVFFAIAARIEPRFYCGDRVVCSWRSSLPGFVWPLRLV